MTIKKEEFTCGARAKKRTKRVKKKSKLHTEYIFFGVNYIQSNSFGVIFRRSRLWIPIDWCDGHVACD